VLLEVVIEGEVDLDEARVAYASLLRDCRRRGVSRMLLDCRALHGGFTPFQRYEFGLYVAERHVHDARREVRVAMVGRAPLVEPGRLGELVAVNRGAPVRVLGEMEEAYRFLGVTAQGEPLEEEAGPG
jgi:hypothetical protein